MVSKTENSVTFRRDDSAIVVRSSASFRIERGRGSKFGCWYALSMADATLLRDELTKVLNENATA